MIRVSEGERMTLLQVVRHAVCSAGKKGWSFQNPKNDYAVRAVNMYER